MIKTKCNRISIGVIVAAIGAAIVLYVILPKAVWWLLIGAALIIIGIGIARRCK